MMGGLKFDCWFLYLATAILFLFPSRPLGAHESRSGYLEITQTDTESYDVFWRVPAKGNLRLGIYVDFPEESQNISSITGGIVGGASMERWSILCPGGLDGREISIRGLSKTMTDVLVRIVRLDGKTQTVRLTPDGTRFLVEPSPSLFQVAGSYLQIGIEHILLGVDHLLFVMGLLLIVDTPWKLFKTITAFTIAHSLTLILATLGLVSVAPEPLNAVIALSILFLGPEIVRVWRGQTSFTIQHPWLVAFFFGLLHGFGFASGLSDLGVSGSELIFGLLMFNVGVELGQIGFVLLALALMKSLKTLEFKWPTWFEYLPGYVIGTLGAYWSIERLLVVFGEMNVS